MRWTAGLLLAILSIIPATLSAQAAGRSVRSAGSTSIGTASATRAVGIATVGASRVSGMLESERAEARESRTKARESKTVIGYEARFGVGVRPRAAGTPQDDVGAEPTGEVSSVPPAPPPVHETTTLAWKPGGIRITGWTDDARPGAMATVKRPDCAAPGLDARCVPENLYAAPPPSGVVATSILAVPLAGPIYPLSYSYYYGLPFPALALSSNTFSLGPTPCPQSPPLTPTRRAQLRKRSSRLFGWLYRSGRNVDME
jgi:hypothetical protein